MSKTLKNSYAQKTLLQLINELSKWQDTKSTHKNPSDFYRPTMNSRNMKLKISVMISSKIIKSLVIHLLMEVRKTEKHG